MTYHGADLQAKDGFAQHLRPCFQAKTQGLVSSQPNIPGPPRADALLSLRTADQFEAMRNRQPCGISISGFGARELPKLQSEISGPSLRLVASALLSG